MPISCNVILFIQLTNKERVILIPIHDLIKKISLEKKMLLVLLEKI